MQESGDYSDMNIDDCRQKLHSLSKPVIIYQKSAFVVSTTSLYFYLGFTGQDFICSAYSQRRVVLDETGNWISVGKMYILE